MELRINSKIVKKSYVVNDIEDGVVTWTTERTGTPGKLEFVVTKNGEINYHEGDLTTFKLGDANDIDLFKGYVFKKVKQQNRIQTTAYDQLRYLKAKQSYNFSGMTAKTVIEKIAGDFGLVCGDVEDTGYVLPIYNYENKTLLDTITDCVSRTNIATNKVYVFFDDFGKLALKYIGNMTSDWVIGNQSFATDYTYTTSIDDAYNYIKLVHPNQATKHGDAYVGADPEAIAQWGVLQYYEKVDESLNPAQIQDLVKQYLNYYCQTQRALKISAVGIPEIRAGSMVTIDIPELGDINLKKMLLVDKCVHKISSQGHFMDLELKVYSG